MSESKEIVLVTGASGCLGQHVVKLLQENDPTVAEIRCMDLKPYQNNLQHKTEKPMKIITGDIRNERTVINALQGVNCVIHCASLVDINLWQDEKSLNAVNVGGTQTLIDACIECNVPYFVHVSTVDVVIGNDPIYYGAEITTLVPSTHLMGAYAKTKFEAEELIVKANGTALSNGTDKLRATILRPTVLYGEEDNHFITNILQTAHKRGGLLQKIDNVFIRCQPTYAGNAAWSCIKAKDKLYIDQSIGGEAFFITDDTEILDPFDFLEPYLKCKGFRLSTRAFPYWLLMIILSLFVFFIRILWPVYQIKLPPGFTPSAIHYLCNTYFFNRNKAILRLNYEPMYGHDEAREKSIQYYKKLYFKE